MPPPTVFHYAMLYAGLGLILFGCVLLLLYLLFKFYLFKRGASVESEEVVGKMKFFGVALEKASPGIVCILVGAALLVLAAHFTSAARDTGATSFGFGALVAPVTAQEPYQQVTGWVFLGPEDDEAQWVLRRVSTGNTAADIMQAKRTIPVREKPFDDWAGTLVGLLLGQEETRVLQRLQPNDCVRVLDRKLAGFNYTWLNVQRSSCSSEWVYVPDDDEVQGWAQLGHVNDPENWPFTFTEPLEQNMQSLERSLEDGLPLVATEPVRLRHIIGTRDGAVPLVTGECAVPRKQERRGNSIWVNVQRVECRPVQRMSLEF